MITIKKGNTLNYGIKISKDDAVYTLGENDKMYLTVKKSPDTEALITKSYGTDDVTYDSKLNAYIFHFTPADTAEMATGRYQYDIHIELITNGIIEYCINTKISHFVVEPVIGELSA